MSENITAVFKNTVKNRSEQGSKRLLTDGGESEVTAIFSRLCELAIADGDVPEDGSGLDSVWTRDLDSRRRDKDWKIAMNPDTQNEERVEGFPVEGSESSIPAGAAVIHYGDWPVGIVRPTHGQLGWEESKDDPEANAIEDDLLRDLEDELIDAGEEIERTIPPQPMATDGGHDIAAKSDDELADLLDGVATAAEPALSNYDLSVIGEAVSRLADGEEVEVDDSGGDTKEWPILADGGPGVTNVDASDLSLFQAAALAIISEEKRYGLAIKRELEDWYGEDVNHGRLYPNLDELVQMGLVEKTERDRRTNDYMATQAGRTVLRELVDFFDARLPDEQLIADGGVAVDSPDVDVDQEDTAFVFSLMEVDDVAVSVEEDSYVVSVTGLDRGTIDAGAVISLANKYDHGIEDVTGDFDDPEIIVEVAR